MDSLKVCVLLFVPGMVLAHSGGLDNQGGHKQHSEHDSNKNSSYHCHKEPCFSIHSQVEQSTQEAIDTNTPLSLIYSREDWKHWSDMDGDCLDTRNEVLLEQALQPSVTITMSKNGCTVLSGQWIDPYSGKTFTNPSDLDIDHVIPMYWVHTHGGTNWTLQKKEHFANDTINLLVVDDGLNQQKGSRGIDEWLPPNQSYHCQYLNAWKRVLDKYSEIHMTVSEAKTFDSLLSPCSD